MNKSICIKLLKVWETLCFGVLIGYVLKLLITGNASSLVPFIFCPSLLFMLLFGEWIYTDRVHWERIKIEFWILPIVVCIFCCIYAFVVQNIAVMALDIGIFILFSLLFLNWWYGKGEHEDV